MTQHYENYTTGDFEVWKILFHRQMNNLQGKVADAFLDALKKIGFSEEKIPDFEEIKKRLAPLTGWSLKVVPNISPQKEFFMALSQKQFTATCWLRKKSQLDYIEEPDMFHDVFGHVPLLTDKNYTAFFKGISEIALENIENEKIIEALGRLYWFTIEFGLMEENGKIKIYGAGIISSSGETENCLSEHVQRQDFDVKIIMNTSFRNDVIQNNYFVIRSFEQLYRSLPEIRKIVEEMKKEKKEKLFL